MTNINLLPWRDEHRESKKKAFFATLGIIVIIAAGVIFLADRFVNSNIDSQKQRNEYLQQQIAVLDGKIAEIREIRDQKAKLTERMSVIQDLHGTRPVIVRVFDELVRTLPSEVYYNSVSRSGDTINLAGIADSSSLVSELMRQLEASDWFSNPVLGQVTANPGEGQESTRNQFALSVKVTTPVQTEEQE